MRPWTDGEEIRMNIKIRTRGRRCLVAVLFSMLISNAAAAGAAAQGGTVRVDTDAGPYQIIAVTGPGAQAGDLLLTVVLTTPSTGDNAWQPVVGAEVAAEFQRDGASTAPISYPLPPEQLLADSGYYERDLTTPGEGKWTVTVRANSPAGQGAASFPITVQRPPAWAGWVTWATILLPVLVVGGVFFYLWRIQRQAPAVPSSEEE